MRHFAALALMAGLLVQTTGCFNIKAYVDPSLEKVGYAALKPPPDDRKIGVSVKAEFRRDGKPLPRPTAELREHVLLVLRQTNLFASVSHTPGHGDGAVEIVVDNTGGSSEGNAYATGLTFGLVGTKTTDRYVIAATWSRKDCAPVAKQYNHAIHATIGSAKGPPGLTETSITKAFDQVAEEAVLLFLRDLQAEGRL